MIETERKFLVFEWPEQVKTGKGTRISQGYLNISEDREIRIRQYGKQHVLTIKSGKGIEREEVEIDISKKQFDLLWPQTEGRRVEKTRYRIPEGNLTIELDVYDGYLTGFMNAEVEFPDRSTAESFKPPWWFGPEVTNEKGLSNARLSVVDDPPPILAEARNAPVPSVGSIPFIRLNGSYRVVLVTTRSGNRWIFPKGNPKDGRDDRETAVEEALEEAGVEGSVVSSPIPTHYWKGVRRYHIAYYPMEVASLHTRWDEEDERQRRICTIEEAHALLDNASFSRALDAAGKQFSS